MNNVHSYTKYIIYISDNRIFIGFSTKLHLQKLLEEGDISPAQVTNFYQSARAFYVQAVKYALDNLPIKDYLLRNASFVSSSPGKKQASPKWNTLWKSKYYKKIVLTESNIKPKVKGKLPVAHMVECYQCGQ